MRRATAQKPPLTPQGARTHANLPPEKTVGETMTGVPTGIRGGDGRPTDG